MLRERFPRFVKVTRGRFSQLMSTKKLLVMAVLEENKLGEITPDMEAFRAMLHSVMENHIDRYRPHYQFGWTGSPDLANSVAMDALSVSTILGTIFGTSLMLIFGTILRTILTGIGPIISLVGLAHPI